MKKFLQGMAVMAALVILVGSTYVIETGPPRCDSFDLVAGAGNTVNSADSLANWQGITSIVIEENAASPAAAVVDCWFRSMKSSIDISAGATVTLPVEFLAMSRILADHGDSVIVCTTGSVRVYVVGG